MKHIIFPTDFSATADNALQYAKALATAYNATIHVLHSFHFTFIGGNEPNESLLLQSEMERRVNDIVSALKEEGFAATGKLELGFLVEEINNMAEQLEDAVIVCGTTGASNALERFLGSNAAAILEDTNVPVWIVPKAAKYKYLRRIAFASALQAKNFAAIDYVFELTEKFDSNLHVVKIDMKNEFHILDEKESAKEIKAHYPNKKLPVLHIKAESVTEGLNHFSHKYHTDLVVMVTHERSFLDKILVPSQTRQFAMMTDTPLLVLHHQPIKETKSNGQNYSSIQA